MRGFTTGKPPDKPAGRRGGDERGTPEPNRPLPRGCASPPAPRSRPGRASWSSCGKAPEFPGEHPRAVERLSDELLDVLRRPVDLDALDRDLDEPGVLEQALQPLGRRQREHPGRVGSGGRVWPSLIMARPGIVAHGFSPPGPRRRPPPSPRASAPAASRAPRRRIDGEHDSPPAQDRVYARGPASRSTRARCANSTLSIPSRRPAPRRLPIILRESSLQTSVPPGLISSAARKPVSPGPAASSRTRCPGPSAACSIIQADTGIPNCRISSALLPHPFDARSHLSAFSARSVSGRG